MYILGIETSCDDTCAAIIDAKGGLVKPRFRILSNIVSSQQKVHQKYGGVVPTLAAREHAKNIAPVLKTAIRSSGIRSQDIDLIGVTTHPGLLPALIVGTHAARTLAWWLKKPILGIDHLEAHIIANWLTPKTKIPTTQEFPAIGLIVSGGHTQLVLIRELNKMHIIGETRDDAAGEAFDKVAKMMGLPFPGGPPIAALAAKSDQRSQKSEIRLPRPMIDSGDFDFSFSGLKTAVLYLLKENPRINKTLVAKEFQQAVIDVLISKTVRAAKKYKAKTVMLGGGVVANLELRKQLGDALQRQIPSTSYYLPSLNYALDNAAMIAAAAYLRWLKLSPAQRKQSSWKKVRVRT